MIEADFGEDVHSGTIGRDPGANHPQRFLLQPERFCVPAGKTLENPARV
jgi:hypothetical protein